MTVCAAAVKGGPGRLAEILLVEDNPSDVYLARMALQERRVANPLHVVEDGALALAFLRRQGRYAQAVRPDLILLDLHLPGMDGPALLSLIKADPALAGIPIGVFASSLGEVTLVRRLVPGADLYLTKPLDLEQLLQAARGLDRFALALLAGAETELPRPP